MTIFYPEYEFVMHFFFCLYQAVSELAFTYLDVRASFLVSRLIFLRSLDHIHWWQYNIFAAINFRVSRVIFIRSLDHTHWWPRNIFAAVRIQFGEH